MADKGKQAELRIDGGPNNRRLVEGLCGHCKAFVQFKDPDEGASLKFTHEIPDEDERTVDYRHHYFIMGVCTRPSCQQPTILYVVESEWSGNWERSVLHREMIFPKESLRPILPNEVPEQFRRAYAEAGAIEFASPTGAAFLAGRILEQALRGKLDSKSNLVKLIDALMERENLPSEMHQLMHDLRAFRNIAGHPASTADGSVIAVDQEEASYTLDILAELLDYLYVRPARRLAMRERHQKKKAGEMPPGMSGLPTVESVGPPPVQRPLGPSPFDADDDDLPF
jgi:hypothetical protein